MTLVKSSSFRQRKEVPCPVHTLLPPQPSAFVLPPRSDDGRLASPNSEAPPRLSMEMELPAVVQEEENSRVDSPEKARDDAPLLSDEPGNTRLLTVAAFAIDRQEGGRPSVVQSDEGGDTFAVPRREEVKWQDKGAEDESPLLSRGVEDASSSDGKAEAHPRNGVMITSESLKEMEVKYAAYVRRDTYGTMGKKDISIWEKALLVLSLIIMVPIKLALLFFILITYYLICRVCTLSGSPLEDKVQENYAHMTGLRRSIIVRSGRFLARALLFVLGFYTIKVTHGDSHRSESSDKDPCTGNGIFHNSYEQPGAIISNHVSYLDILYHMSASFPSFVAKRSVGKLPLVGLISKCLGCVYVQREDKSSNFKGVSGVVTERLRAAHGDKNAPVMMLFPEGTTTNGGFLLPFKTGAFLAQTPVQPVILKYPYNRFSPAWDTISGVRHLILLLCQFINHLEVVWLPIYIPSEKEKSDPKVYADNVRTLMAREGALTLSDIGLHEKRIYHAALNGLTAAEL